ncbi:MAG: serine/threonine protein kinase [Proteobacteria bacterium]|nr:serine/threonine protein kinase [Pseudomonadota bacterium]
MQPRRRFRFIKELAEGGFGKVYLAEMITGDDFSSVVAIKLLHGKWTTHEEIAQRSRDEARLLGRLRHRNIVRVEDLTSIRGQCAVVMEYLEGVDLKTLVNYLVGVGDRFALRSVFQIIGNVANALHAAYNHVPLQGGEPLRLIHRDIKPSNVMLTADGDVKLLDFGTARANFESREAHTQALAFGSQAYMAPERLLGDPDTPAADVFSLGVTTYEIIAGGAFGKIHIRPDRYEKAVADRLDSLDLSGLDDELRDRVRATLKSMLQYEPEDRPSGEQVVDIMEILADESKDESLRRFAKKYVGPAMTSNPHMAEGPSLAGSTVFEDRSGTIETDGLPTSDSASFKKGETYPIDPNQQTFDEPEPAAITYDDPVEDTFDSGFEARVESPLRPSPDVPPPLEEAATMLPDDEMRESLDPELRDTLQGPVELVEASTAMADPEALQDQLRASESQDAAEVSHVVDFTPPEHDKPAAPDIVWQPPPPPEPEAEPEPVETSSSKGPMIAVGVILLLAVLGGGGYAVTQLENGDPTVEPVEDPVVDPIEDPVVDPAVDPVVEDAPDPVPTDETGVVTLTVFPPGPFDLALSNSVGFKTELTGDGRAAIGDLAEGTYRTKVRREDGSSHRGTLTVTLGQTCSFRVNTGTGDDWEALGCE